MKDFLDLIHPPHGYTEMRFIRDGDVKRAFYTPPEALISDALKVDADGWDVYVGVLPRQYQSGTEKDVWPVATVLWADVDAKDFQHPSDALDAVLRFPVPPSVIVDSGHGFHCYWRLTEPIDTAEAVTINKAIARWLPADACFDAPRILRVPGTHNHKDEEPVPVRLLRLDTLRTYTPADFHEMVESMMQAELRSLPPVQYERREDAPSWLSEKLNTEPPKGSRSEYEFGGVMSLIRRHYTDDEIVQALMNMPFGAKAQERGERWAEGEVRRARAKA